jgi:hypothetical protein
MSWSRGFSAALAVAASIALGACGSSASKSSTHTSTSPPASSTTSTSATCQNQTECSTQTTGQLLSDVSISDPSSVQAIDSALLDEYNTQARNAGQQTGYVIAQSLCVPVGGVDGFPANDYMCGGIETSTSTGQQSNALTTLYNVRSDGTVYWVGSPCLESTPASGCDANYWGLVQSQNLSASSAPAPATTTTASSTDCGSFNDPSASEGDPKHFSDVTVVGASCAIARAVAISAGEAPGSSGGPKAAEGFACSFPPDPPPYAQCSDGSVEVDLYTS